jgi:hypothetical protein
MKIEEAAKLKLELNFFFFFEVIQFDFTYCTIFSCDGPAYFNL